MTDPSATGLARGVRLRSATALVVASMIGAGIFTTTGFQAQDLGHPGWILFLWALGGLLAWCGALCFAELGAMMPNAGAEYVYIREAYGEAFAFMSAFVALVAGFSAPIAGALKGLIRYLGHFIPIFADDPRLAGLVSVNDLAAIVLTWALVALHARGLRIGLGFTDAVTAFKVLGIICLVAAAVIVGKGVTSQLTEISPTYEALGTLDLISNLATSLIFVNFCYLGWNGAAYMAGEMKDPQRDLPRALLLGTGLVTALYLALNLVYLYAAGVTGISGTVEVGLVAAKSLFGPTGTSAVAALLCVSILASASAMTAQGPRVYYAFGQNVAPAEVALDSLTAFRRAGQRACPARCCDNAAHPEWTRRPDSPIRRLHAHAFRQPRGFLHSRVTGPAPGCNPAVPRVGVSHHAACLSARLRLDHGLGVARPPPGIVARSPHRFHRRSTLRDRVASGVLPAMNYCPPDLMRIPTIWRE